MCTIVHTPSIQHVCTIFLLLYLKYSTFFLSMHSLSTPMASYRTCFMHTPCTPFARPMHTLCTSHAHPLHVPCTSFARHMHTLCAHLPIYLNSINTKVCVGRICQKYIYFYFMCCKCCLKAAYEEPMSDLSYERLHPKRITSYQKNGQFRMCSKTSIMNNE